MIKLLTQLPNRMARPLRLALGAAVVALAAALRVWPLHHLGSSLAWLTFYPAVMALSLYGGLLGGLMATSASCLIVVFFWPFLVSQPFIRVPADYLGMAVFIFNGLMISGISQALLQSKEEALNDLAALKRAEADLTLAASVFQSTLEGILVTDADQVILSVNPAFSEITGFASEDALGRTPRILKSHHHDPAFYSAMWRDLSIKGRWQGEIWNRRKDGNVYLEWITITKIRTAAGEPVRYVSVFHDITEHRKNDDRTSHLAFHDALTDLPNRPLLMNRLDHQLAKAERAHETMAVMFLDLDRFKAVNDNYGHGVGDDVLKAVAQKLLAQVRATDTVSRLGGDEFVILLDAPASMEDVVMVATRIIEAVQEPMELRGVVAKVGTSIGIAMFPTDGRSAGDLIQNADWAMYSAKESGRNTYRFFRSEDSIELSNRQT